MIRYVKGAPPRRLTELAATPSMSWDGLGARDRDSIRAALIHDQAGLCAYCQQRISPREDASTGRSQMKIEHWTPRSASADHHLTWANLLGVCLGGAGEVDRKARHCDEHRGDQKLFLHPVEGQGADPREHLQYTKAGEVCAVTDDRRVASDISALNLNARKLVRARRAVLDELWKRLEKHGFATRELRRMDQLHNIEPGTSALEHAGFVQFHIRKKLRRRGESPG